jgi:hypothetical protein
MGYATPVGSSDTTGFNVKTKNPLVFLKMKK